MVAKEAWAMLNYSGSGRVDYEDVLRAIGHFIDEHNFKEICIIELEEGILVRGLVYSAQRAGARTISEAYLFTNEDIDRILEEAYKRRASGKRAEPVQPTRIGG
jgi:hypothetical protein